jgi:hypothetical protein
LGYSFVEPRGLEPLTPTPLGVSWLSWRLVVR